MKRLILIGLIMAMAAGFHSCTEDEFLKPTTINLQIKMINTKPFDNLPEQAKKNMLEFTGGKFYIKSIEFEGERENSDNHYFTREFKNTLSADLTENLNQDVSFDIPQGIYNHIKIKINTPKNDSLPGLRLGGKWKWQMGRPGQSPPQNEDEIPVELNFFRDQKETIELTVNTEAGVGNGQIVFDGDNWNTLEIRVNLASMFRYFTPERFQNANSQHGNKHKIIISDKHNTDMYNSLAERVGNWVKAVIK